MVCPTSSANPIYGFNWLETPVVLGLQILSRGGMLGNCICYHSHGCSWPTGGSWATVTARVSIHLMVRVLPLCTKVYGFRHPYPISGPALKMVKSGLPYIPQFPHLPHEKPGRNVPTPLLHKIFLGNCFGGLSFNKNEYFPAEGTSIQRQASIQSLLATHPSLVYSNSCISGCLTAAVGRLQTDMTLYRRHSGSLWVRCPRVSN